MLSISLSDDQWFAIIVAVIAQVGAISVAWLVSGRQDKRERERFLQGERRAVYAKHNALVGRLSFGVARLLYEYITDGEPKRGSPGRSQWDAERTKLMGLSHEISELEIEVNAVASSDYHQLSHSITSKLTIALSVLSVGDIRTNGRERAESLMNDTTEGPIVAIRWLSEDVRQLYRQMRKDLGSERRKRRFKFPTRTPDLFHAVEPIAAPKK